MLIVNNTSCNEMKLSQAEMHTKQYRWLHNFNALSCSHEWSVLQKKGSAWDGDIYRDYSNEDTVPYVQ